MQEYLSDRVTDEDLAWLDSDPSLVDFAAWYLSKGEPKRFSLFETSLEYPEVFVSDDATSVRQFVYKQFQVELYLIHPTPVVPEHEHPGVEAIEITPRFWQWKNRQALERRVLRSGMSHGDATRSAARLRGFYLLSIQRWEDGLSPTTISSRWKGKTAGPMHESIIRRFNPHCLIKDGYADTTVQVKE